MKNELAIIDNSVSAFVPTPEDIAIISQEIGDLETIPFGKIAIAGAGANVFKVTEPGDDEPTSVMDIEGVIIWSHKQNALWLRPMGSTEDKSPDCFSMDAVIGTVKETGECYRCDGCQYNEYGSNPNGPGKACKNMRLLYIMRSGDIFPMVLQLPPTAIRIFDNYRTKVVMDRRRMDSVVTKITLKTQKSQGGIDYSVPVFNMVGALTKEDAMRLADYTKNFKSAVTAKAANQTPKNVADENGFVEIDDNDLPL